MCCPSSSRSTRKPWIPDSRPHTPLIATFEGKVPLALPCRDQGVDLVLGLLGSVWGRVSWVGPRCPLAGVPLIGGDVPLHRGDASGDVIRGLWSGGFPGVSLPLRDQREEDDPGKGCSGSDRSRGRLDMISRDQGLGIEGRKHQERIREGNRHGSGEGKPEVWDSDRP